MWHGHCHVKFNFNFNTESRTVLRTLLTSSSMACGGVASRG